MCDGKLGSCSAQGFGHVVVQMLATRITDKMYRNTMIFSLSNIPTCWMQDWGRKPFLNFHMYTISRLIVMLQMWYNCVRNWLSVPGVMLIYIHVYKTHSWPVTGVKCNRRHMLVKTEVVILFFISYKVKKLILPWFAFYV